MRNRLLGLSDKLLLRKRALIVSITDQLKNICQIEHTRHHSPTNFLVHLMAGLITYCHQPKKPSLRLQFIALLGGVAYLELTLNRSTSHKIRAEVRSCIFSPES